MFAFYSGLTLSCQPEDNVPAMLKMFLCVAMFVLPLSAQTCDNTKISERDFQEVVRLGKLQGYPYAEVKEAVDAKGFCETRAFLRKRIGSVEIAPGTIKVIGMSTWNKERDVYIPGSNSTSTTDCSAFDYSLSCSTTTTPGNSPHTYVRKIHQAEAQALMPDGSAVTLWCQRGWRYCADLSAGTYRVEIDKNIVWVYVPYYADKPKYNPDGTAQPRDIRTARAKYKIIASY